MSCPKHYRPGPGWFQYKQTPAVWEHKPTGVRVHVAGLIRLAPLHTMWMDKAPFRPLPQFLIKVNGGNRKRGLMAWAMIEHNSQRRT